MTTKNSIPEEGYVLRWYGFMKERFTPVQFVPMIISYFTANAAVAFLSAGRTAQMRGEIAGIAVIFMVFLHLRIFDEIKDYEKDLVIHPDRPLPRGAISIIEAKGLFAS